MGEWRVGGWVAGQLTDGPHATVIVMDSQIVEVSVQARKQRSEISVGSREIQNKLHLLSVYLHLSTYEHSYLYLENHYNYPTYSQN